MQLGKGSTEYDINTKIKLVQNAQAEQRTAKDCAKKANTEFNIAHNL